MRKWVRALSGNVLWAVLFLPAVIAIASSALASISYLFFHLPFMRAVRIPGAAQATQRRDGSGAGPRSGPGSGPGKRQPRAGGDGQGKYDESESVAAGG